MYYQINKLIKRLEKKNIYSLRMNYDAYEIYSNFQNIDLVNTPIIIFFIAFSVWEMLGDIIYVIYISC